MGVVKNESEKVFYEVTNNFVTNGTKAFMRDSFSELGKISTQLNGFQKEAKKLGIEFSTNALGTRFIKSCTSISIYALTLNGEPAAMDFARYLRCFNLSDKDLTFKNYSELIANFSSENVVDKMVIKECLFLLNYYHAIELEFKSRGVKADIVTPVLIYYTKLMVFFAGRTTLTEAKAKAIKSVLAKISKSAF